MRTSQIEIDAKVKQLITDKLGAPQEILTSEATFADDIGADSLDMAELFMTIEKEFRITLPDEHAEKLKTVGKVIAYVEAAKK